MPLNINRTNLSLEYITNSMERHGRNYNLTQKQNPTLGSENDFLETVRKGKKYTLIFVNGQLKLSDFGKTIKIYEELPTQIICLLKKCTRINCNLENFFSKLIPTLKIETYTNMRLKKQVFIDYPKNNECPHSSEKDKKFDQVTRIYIK